MKKLILLLFIFTSLQIFSQTEYKITSKKRVPLKGNHLKLKSIVNDGFIFVVTPHHHIRHPVN